MRLLGPYSVPTRSYSVPVLRAPPYPPARGARSLLGPGPSHRLGATQFPHPRCN